MNGDHPNYIIVENSQNTEKSLGDSSERLSANARVESSQGVNNNSTRHCHQKSGKKSGEIGTKSMNGDHPNYSAGKIGQNTEKSPRD